MAGCFRFKGDFDDMRLEWDAYIDSTISDERTLSDLSRDTSRADMTDRGIQCQTGQDDCHLRPAYRDAPCQPLLASRGSYLGQMKISVYLNCGLLTCHVIQARHLSSKRGGTCDPYVKLSLVPDESLRTRCKTDVVMDTNSPLFDEKFSFELIDEDMRKRLFISVWNKIPGKECKDEFLGCMSFGIRHIQNDKRSVNGWYYLLHEDVGRRKHLQAAVKKQQLREQTPNNNNNIPKVNQDIMWMDPYTITITKAKSGYGFTVSGFSPVFVSKLEKGSTAERAGLMKDDCIVRIDGLNVSRSTSDSVAKLIRSTQKQLTLDIQRPQVVRTMELAPTVHEPWQAVSSTPLTRGAAPPSLHVSEAAIPTRRPLPPPSRPPPPPPPAPAWNMEVESKEPVYGNCGVFGESDPLYSTVTPKRHQVQPYHTHVPSSESSSSGYHDNEPEYGMIRLPPSARRLPSSTGGATSAESCSSGTSGTWMPPQRDRNSSSGGSADAFHPHGVYSLPRNRKSAFMAAEDAAAVRRACAVPRSQSSLGVGAAGPTSGMTGTYVTVQFPKSMSSGGLSRADIYNHYRLCHDMGDVYTSQPVMANAVTSHEDFGIYGHSKSNGSTGSTGSADSGGLRRSKTLPRKKKVHFQELR